MLLGIGFAAGSSYSRDSGQSREGPVTSRLRKGPVHAILREPGTQAWTQPKGRLSNPDMRHPAPSEGVTPSAIACSAPLPRSSIGANSDDCGKKSNQRCDDPGGAGPRPGPAVDKFSAIVLGGAVSAVAPSYRPRCARQCQPGLPVVRSCGRRAVTRVPVPGALSM